MTWGQFERASHEARAHENPQRAKDWAFPSLALRVRCGCQVARRVCDWGDGRAGWKSQKDEGADTTVIQGDELVLLTLPPTKVPASVGEALHVPKKRAVWASTARSGGGRTTASPLGECGCHWKAPQRLSADDRDFPQQVRDLFSLVDECL